MKQKLISLAWKEGMAQRKGDYNKAGPQIERYLHSIRLHLCKTNPKYLDLNVGFDWCCAFIHYLLIRAGYKLELTPLIDSTWHLGAVRTWYEFALEENKFLDNNKTPERGNLVIFDYLLESVELDHIGIVLEVENDIIISSEGNVNNSTGIFRRIRKDNVRGYIKL